MIIVAHHVLDALHIHYLLFQTTETPVTDETVTVVATGVNDGQAELLLNDDTELTVQAELLAEVTTAGTSVEELTTDGPVCLAVTKRGSEIISVKFYESKTAVTSYVYRKYFTLPFDKRQCHSCSYFPLSKNCHNHAPSVIEICSHRFCSLSVTQKYG